VAGLGVFKTLEAFATSLDFVAYFRCE